ncbi:hypothetical protein, partial [Serratia marcescens]|uniref:hypothetical protein n=1 Tax=Serratia marcescens TaxID=615 RepID=UPI0027E3F060
AKVSIHSDGSFEGLGCVLANTNLNVLTAVFYWFTLKRDEPFFIPFRPTAVRCAPTVQRATFFVKQTVVSRRGLLDHRRLCVALCIEEQ